ncbi:MAG: flagellum-specific ATP synthase FliI, partial [Pseudomonadota bacterium]|nr:flagellum-specific ATP synthase FliI [Pseudomonadota bacterium]
MLQIDGSFIRVLPEVAPDGIALRDRAILRPVSGFAPADHWIGRLIDPFGNPLDGKPLMPGPTEADVIQSPPPAATRRPLGTRLNTGLAVTNTLLPLVEGQRIGLFAGSGVGKSRLM